MDPILNNLFYNIQQSTSFRNIRVLYDYIRQHHPNIDKPSVENWLRGQLTHLVFKPIRKKYNRNPIVSKHIDHLWNIDLVELAYPENNENYKYLLTVIDNLSKYAWVKRFTNKKAETVVNALQEIIEESGRKPTIIGSDFGAEFTNRRFKQWITTNNIVHYIMYSPSKATIVERFNQTLKNLLYKYLFYYQTRTFIDVLDQIVNNYNHTVHSATKYRPVDVDQTNQRRVYQNLYKYRYKLLEKQKFNVGDHVLIPDYVGRDPTKMSRKFLRPKYKSEVYVVHKVYKTSPRFKYVVREVRSGHIVNSSFYDSQLIKTNL